MTKRTDIAIIGRACRLPGASSVEELWQLLSEGRCAVSKVPADRWSLERFGHPRANERGKSYTWAAGVIDDVWSFDPGVFNISPREAEQMDPQQRLLLELTWEALEDAGIRPSSVAGQHIGVYVGASSLDYGNLRILDTASGDAYAATGNVLSIISNRISYIYDLKGPSFTLDTACSSSLVALDTAIIALQSGQVDTAIVAGVNVLASPFNFISFSNAGMLSRTGLCQAFSANADGYVRAEGGVVLVLQTAKAAARDASLVRGVIAASGVNSDGRTTGISLPSGTAQAALLEQVYREAGIDLDSVAFVEAHGTGTPVGDPIEATAIGSKLGKGRKTPLPIGSIKTNIGHTEPVSGLAGLLKATLALEHDVLPPSLHSAELNPDIPFQKLNLSVNRAPLALPRGKERFAGVNSFGFGGTNAHVVLTDPAPVSTPANDTGSAKVLLLSAQSRAALNDLALDYAERAADAKPAKIASMAAAAAHRRERLPVRLAMPLDRDVDVATALRAIAEGEDTDAALAGTAADRAAQVAFVFSGNGSQWGGMGREAYEQNPVFAKTFDKTDALFRPLSGWSLKEAMFAADAETRISETRVSQPLIFAIQAASVEALKQQGLAPKYVLGHSVGEIGAAYAAGILSLEQAVRVIFFRSQHQETTRGLGTMAVLLGPVEEMETFLKDYPTLDIAAYNSPKAVTVAGPKDAIDAAMKALTRKRRRGRKLDLEYPFHGRLMDPTEKPLLRDLAGLKASAGHTAMISTVTGTVLSGTDYGAGYWWRNIREPVRFCEGLQEAVRQGVRVFVEVGPRATLLSHVGDAIEPLGTEVATVGVLHRKPAGGDPIAKALAAALVAGAAVDEDKVFGPAPTGPVSLPSYPWQRRAFRLAETNEGFGPMSPRPHHPLAGTRLAADGLEWHSAVDAGLVPELDDHRIDGQVILPGAAFVEMALHVARETHRSEAAVLADLEILSPMVFAEDSLRDVSVRLSGSGNIVQILSRPRLTQAPWQLHASAKIVDGTFKEPGRRDVELPESHAVEGIDLYRRAEASGLGFGPNFRQVARSARIDETTIVSELKPAEADARYGLVPARLDACFHGLILLFAELLGEDSVKAYVPVRFGEVRLNRPGAVIHRAVITTRRCNERSILADFTLLDEAGDIVASIREGRFQALRAKGGNELAAYAIAQGTELATEPTAIPLERQPSIAATVRPAAKPSILGSEAPLGPGHLLLEGWATSLAYRLASGLERNGLVALNTLPEELRSWATNALYALEGSGLADLEGSTWRLRHDATIPAPEEIMRWIAADHPELSAELLLVADVTALVSRLLDGKLKSAAQLPQAALDAFTMRSATARASADVVARVFEAARQKLPRDRAVRILQVGFGPLSSQAAAFAESVQGKLTLFETDRRLAERARLAMPGRVSVVETLEEVSPASFDLLLASNVLHRTERNQLETLSASLATGGLLVAVEPTTSLFRDMVFGLNEGWFDGTADMPAGRLEDVAGWQRVLSAAGLVRVTADRAASVNGNDLILVAEAPARPMPAHGQRFAFVIGSEDAYAAETASSLATLLVAAGVHVSIILDSEQSLMELGRETPDTVVFLAGAFAQGGTSSGEIAERLRERCLSLKRCTEHLGSRQTQLWVIAPGATREGGGEVSAVETGVWAFSRTLANETANLDVRRVDLAPSFSSKRSAERLRDLILSGTAETEIVLDEDATRVVRFHPGQTQPRVGDGAEPATAARLERSNAGGLNEMAWGPAERVAPAPGHVEIAVEATGLNFRDVLWALNMLPEEILEDGFAGPRLGLEVAGRIVSVGSGVTDFNVGDPVVAFAQSGFATHIVVPEMVVAPRPVGLEPAAAATVPVAFLTAYYALVSCARLRKGEWVLVHGGAGGVGLAALQIARWKGARVIATAGSREKRALVEALGAEHVLDSRSLSFVDDIRAITKDGVDVVLNSLFGEMMERSLNCLKPFGRFVELGKRDYVANTHIGLRPFRRNLSYFGVDLDQVLQHQGEDGARMFREVIGLFGDAGLKPLPYQPFTADEVSDAFRLMQQSGHIGKIVVTPPKPGSIARERTHPFTVSAQGVHIVTGGLGGFGIEAAKWLGRRGARHLVLVGRSGKPNEQGEAVIAELRAQGVSVETKACDITSRRAVETLLSGIERSGRAIAGIIHGAMVLQDGLIANLDAEALEAVIRPKVIGAQILDAATRQRTLDYFVMFSSATTFIGNPGQGAYVAANGFMEGLARQRRRQGLPALAVAWGAIGDVGVLARNKAVMETLAGRVGVTPMDARHCLDLMAEALGGQRAGTDEAVIAIAAMHWGKARERLATLRSPSYGALGSDQQAEAGTVTTINIAQLLKSGDGDEVRKTVADAIVEDIARILRLPKDDISRTRQLSEIGLDSLMGVELGASLQERFALDAPPAGISSGLTINELADTLIQAVATPLDESAGASLSLAQKHLGTVDAEKLSPFKDLVEQTAADVREITQ